MRIKIIDKLLLKALIPHLVVTFGIAIFILVMQQLWIWIDEIAGKGLGFFTLLELLFYMSLVVFPLSLLVAILLSAVMVYGGLAETYQLTVLKSNGISLIRVLRSSLVLMGILAVFSLTLSNYFIPKAQIQFHKKFKEIRNKKPTLSLEPGVFNNDFSGFSIRIGSKEKNGVDVNDVMLYDMSGGNQFNLIYADTGKMWKDPANSKFIVRLYDGTVYQDYQKFARGPNSQESPFLRMQFEEYTKVFDLSHFNISEVDRSTVSDSKSTMRGKDILVRIDTFNNQLERYDEFVQRKIALNLPFIYKDALERLSDTFNVRDQLDKNYFDISQLDSTEDFLFKGFTNNDRHSVISNAKSSAERISDEIYVNLERIRDLEYQKITHRHEFHYRLSVAVTCLLFLLIGAPMGAIVRKGGFGYPLLISIVFFVAYVISSIMFRKLAFGFKMHPILAAWMPVLIILPIAVLLSLISFNDRKLSFKAITEVLRKLFTKKKLSLNREEPISTQ